MPGPCRVKPPFVAITTPGLYGASASPISRSLTSGPYASGRIDKVDAKLHGAAQHLARVLRVLGLAPHAVADDAHRAEAKAVDLEIAAQFECFRYCSCGCHTHLDARYADKGLTESPSTSSVTGGNHQRVTLAQNLHALHQPAPLGVGHQPHRRLFHRLAPQRKRAVVHRHHHARPQVDKRLQCLFRACVHRAVVIREVRADRQQRRLRLQPAANLVKAVEVGCVARVVHPLPGSIFQHIAAKQAMRIVDHARAPVLRRRQRHLQPRGFGRLPPTQRAHLGEAQRRNQILYAIRHNRNRRPAGLALGRAHYQPQRRPVQVIHVRVCQQDHVDRRKVVDAHARLFLTAQDDKPRRKHRVNQHVGGAGRRAKLQQKRRVALKHHAKLARTYRNRLLRHARYRLLMAFPRHAGYLAQLGDDERPSHAQSAHTLLMHKTRFRRICTAPDATQTRNRIYRISLTNLPLPFPGPRWRVVHVEYPPCS